MLNKADVMAKVIQAVGHVQEVSGRSSGVINSSTKPVSEVAGFDSLSGVEATVILSESLGRDIPDENPFVSKDGRRAMSVSEVTDNLCELIGVEAKN